MENEIHGDVPNLPEALCVQEELLEDRLIELAEAMQENEGSMPPDLRMQIELEQALVIDLLDERE